MAGESATTFATAPTVHFHPNSQSAALSGGRVLSCPDLRGLADLTGSGTTGPLELTDALGRKFWRFNGAQYATIANTLNAIANRAITTMMVVRVHKNKGVVNFLNPRFASYTSDSVNTGANASVSMMRATVVSNSAQYLSTTNAFAYSNATDKYKAIPGCQLQVAGAASRTTANGGVRFYLNNDTCDVAQVGTSVTGYVGAIIGGGAGASNTANVSTSVGNIFDLYELAIWKGELSNEQADASAAALVANYSIAQLTQQLLLEGDSITDGVPTTAPVSPTSSGNVGMMLSEPGSNHVPASCRVINGGASGSNVSPQLLARRDTANSMASAVYPGGPANNRVAIQIGRNDTAVQATGTADNVYASIVALLNTESTGFLQRGWSVTQVGNIAASNANLASAPEAPITIHERIAALRNKFIDPVTLQTTEQFKADTGSNVGGAFEGLVTTLPVHKITVGGQPQFETAADAAATVRGYYDSDQTHLTLAGQQLMASGGNTPQYGYFSLLATVEEDTPPTITSASKKTGQVGVALSYTITATGTAPITYGASGLPAGLTYDPVTGAITGTPTTEGVTASTITASNSAGSDSETLTFTIASAPTPGPTSGNLSLFNQLAEAVGATGGHRYNLDALNAISQQLTGSAGHTRNLAALNAIAGFYIGSTQSFTLNIDALNAITGKLGGASNNTRTVDALAGWLGKL